MKLKLFAFLLFILWIPAVLEAQTATVTGTVTDSDSQKWVSGTYKIEFYPNPSYPNLSQYYLSGVPLSNYTTNFSGNLGSTASFSQGNIPRNDLITPVGSKWKFYFCSLTSAPCNDFTQAITGNVDITTSISANIKAPRFQAIYGSFGYNDSEPVLQTNAHSVYYNVISTCTRSYDPIGVQWVCPIGLSSTSPIFTGTMTGPNVNVTGYVQDAITPIKVTGYGAKCDGTTLDTTAIQNAFTAAHSQGRSVEFPQGTCKTDTIVWYGTSFHGAGRALTTILGLPGRDIFQTQDSAVNLENPINVYDINLIVDDSLNVSATAGGGNNTFPNRIAGTLGGTTPLANPIAPGPILFGPTIGNGNAGSMTAGSNVLTVPRGTFIPQYNPLLINAPVTVHGAGPSGADLVTTITSLIDFNNVHLAANASTTGTNFSGQYGNMAPITPPWYVGNCAIAVPQTDGSVLINGVNMWTFRNVWFHTVNNGMNNSCGVFFQAPVYDMHFEHVLFQHMWYGYIEALPAINTGSIFAWTPDTSAYRDINFSFDLIPAVMINGTHRNLDNWSIYGGQAFVQGLYWYGWNGYPTGTVTHYYDECAVSNSGEHARFTGVVNISGGNLDQCGAGPYVRFDTNYSTIDAQIDNLMVTGRGNVFHHANSGVVSDTGVSNRIDAMVGYAASVVANLNRPHENVNRLDPSFITTGNVITPFTSGNDLLVTCDQFNFAFQNNAISTPNCISDPTGTEVTQSYFHATPAAVDSYQLTESPTQYGQGPYGKFLRIGDRLPQARMTVVILARCSTACTQFWTINDYNPGTGVSTGLNTQTLVFGTSWTLQTISYDASTVPVGHSIGVVGQYLWNQAAWQDLAYIGFQPEPKQVNMSTALALQATAPGRDQLLFPCRGAIRWAGPPNPGACQSDITSPTLEYVYIPTSTGSPAIVGSGTANWVVGTNFVAQPYVFSISAKTAGTPNSANLTLTTYCGNTSLTTVTYQIVSLAYETLDVPGDYTNCAAGQAVSVYVATANTYDIAVGAVVVRPSQWWGITSSIGGSALAAGACVNGTVTIKGVSTSMAIVATSQGVGPGDAFYYRAYASAQDTVTVKVCAAVAGTPTASTYFVKAIP